MRVLFIDFNPFMPPVTPISIGNVAAVLKERGHEVRTMSLGSTTPFSPRLLRSFLSDYAPRLVGFGVYQRNMMHIQAIAALVKDVLPDAFVVLGGPQVTYLPEAALASMEWVDFLSRGEGEQSIAVIAEAIEGGTTDQPLPGVTTRSSTGECLTGPTQKPPKNLDVYPSPWLTGALDPAETDESIMLTSRGCGHKCAFCYTPAAFGGRIRAQSVERVLEDITWVARRGTGRLWFADPNFSFSKKRVHQILEGALERDLKLQMWVETRADMLSPELIKLLKRAGVHTVALGLESASPRVFPGLDKGIDPDKIGQAARDLLAAGLDVELFSQYALPNETKEDALMTLRFVQDCGVKIRGNSNAQQMQLYFGSAIHDDLESYGVRPLRTDLPPHIAIGTQFETDWMKKEEIDQVRDAWKAASLDGGKRVVS